LYGSDKNIEQVSHASEWVVWLAARELLILLVIFEWFTVSSFNALMLVQHDNNIVMDSINIRKEPAAVILRRDFLVLWLLKYVMVMVDVG